MGDFVVAGILIIIVGAAVLYIIKEKKKGTRCIGCPSAGSCPSKGCCNTKAKHSDDQNKK